MPNKRWLAVLAAVAGVALAVPTAASASVTAASRPGYPCQLYHFCAWDQTGPNPATLLFDISGTIPCGQLFELGAGIRNRMGSINNMTSGTWELKDGAKVVFTADENAWGNLPAAAQNNVDNMRFVCT